MRRKKVCITGGAGYVGSTLAQKLVGLGYAPYLLDWAPPTSTTATATIPFLEIDIRDETTLTEAFQGASIVFHVASYGMSGSAQLNRTVVEDINIVGTEAVIAAAIAAGVERLVFTSTYNVVFGGQSITSGDESMPYFPFKSHVDAYSRSKALAEVAVLSANGTLVSPPIGQRAATQRTTRSRNLAGNVQEKGSERRLWTCAVRPAAIWGAMEQRHTPRVVSYLEKGLFVFVFGDSAAKMDFVHVENLVEAHILAAEGLTEDRGRVAAGQVYFISDGEERRINNFEFFKPLVEGLGYRYPRIRLPLQFIFFIALLTEVFHVLMARWVSFEPFLTRAEVYKAGVNHWFRIEKARKELGYMPKEYSIDEVVKFYRRKGHDRRTRGRRRHDGDGGGTGVLGGSGRSLGMLLMVAMVVVAFCGIDKVW